MLDLKCFVYSFVLIYVSLLKGLDGVRTSFKIYQDIQSDIFCFRRLNATHQIGCASHRNGNVGVLHMIDDVQGIHNLTDSPPSMSFVVAMPISLFNMQNMKLIQQTANANGVLIFKPKTADPPHSFSPDQSCPNRNFGFYTEKLNPDYAHCKKTKWNELSGNNAKDMMFQDWGMPIFIITNETSIDHIKSCYDTFNKPINGTVRGWPLCSIQMNSIMLAAKDTDTCMRRNNLIANLNEGNQVKTCDPLSDKNIVTTLFPTNKSEEVANESIILVSARLDTFSMFDRLAPGAHSTVTGLVTLLTVAKIMADLKDELKDISQDRNILFALFNGEAFDYIGSSRVVYDMQKGVFPVRQLSGIADQPAPLTLNHISHFLELSQLGPSELPAQLWLHTDPVSMKSDPVSQKVKEMIDLLQSETKRVGGSVKMAEAPSAQPLPPASFQSFLKQNATIPGIVIADHENEFINKYYNSIFDTNDTVSEVVLKSTIAKVASILSGTLYQLLSDKPLTKTLEPEDELVGDLLECYLVNASCSLFRQIADPSMTERLLVEPYPLYVSVDSGGLAKANAITLYTRYLMAYLTGEKSYEYSRNNCTGNVNNQIYQYDWMAGSNESGVCIKSTVMYTIAQSPAFVLNDWKSTEYSTWTESVWLETSARIFLQPGTGQQVATLLTGIVIFLLSIGSVYFINDRSSIIFNTRPLVGC